jgi:uncharacterized protein with HEPN domain
MRRDDEIRLRHMLEAAREAVKFIGGRSRKDLSDDRMLALAGNLSFPPRRESRTI